MSAAIMPWPTKSSAGGPLVSRVHARLLAQHQTEESPLRARVAYIVREEAPLLGEASLARVVEEVLAKVVGLGPLEPLLADPTVTEVMVNGPGQVWVERAGVLERVSLDLDEDDIEHLIEKVVAPLGLRVDRASPPALAMIGGGAAAGAPLLALRAFRGRGDARYEAGLPPALDAVARALRSGASLRQAISEAGRGLPGAIGAALTLTAGASAQGVPLVSALEEWASRRPLPSVRLAVAALCLGAETGGAQARAVDGVAATVRERLAVAAEVRALSSQARASALVMVASPLAFCAYSAATDGDTSAFLFRTPVGLGFLAAGLGLDALGALWMARLSRVRP